MKINSLTNAKQSKPIWQNKPEFRLGTNIYNNLFAYVNDFHYFRLPFYSTSKKLKPYHLKSISPDIELDKNDPGDDVQRRFHYQNSYAAIACCALLQRYGVAEVYCEHHEDVLVKFNDKLFEGIQIKTKQLHLPGFSFFEETIQKAIKKFINLDQKYPGKFKSFKLVTNTSFQKKAGDNFQQIIKLAIEKKKDELMATRTKTKKSINLITKELKCSVDDVLSTLSKITLREEFSNLNDNRKHLADELNQIPALSNLTLGKLHAIGGKIISQCHNAASKTNEEISECYLLGKKVADETQKAIIEGKKFTRKKIQSLIDEVLTSELSHFLKDDQSLGFKASGTKTLEIKMDAGGIDNANINLLKDLKYSFEAFSLSWLHKFDSKTAADRYNQIQIIVQSECQEAFDESIKNNILFGHEMLINLRKRLRSRLATDRHIFLDCDYEHLMGLAAVLTEDCKVWWSNHFKIEVA